MVIVDTSVLIDYLSDRSTPQTDWLEQRSDLRRIGVTSLILCEVLQGIRSDDQFSDALKVMRQFALYETGSNALAVASARNYGKLRGLGITIRSTIDSFIATFCIEAGHQLLHSDRDFDVFEKHLGLKVLHPPTNSPN
jgi:predicted nucleic acid-binding protein